ncbi:MAG: OstA-like protein [Crocinitomicaceae bacterium]
MQFFFKIILQALFLSALFFPVNLLSQEDIIRLVYAETVKDAEGYTNTTKAIGNVHFEHNKSQLYCDSALFFRDKDLVYAYSNVHINQGDTINLYCDSLRYDGKTKISKLKGNVRMRDNTYKLITDSLEYHGDKSMGFYKNNAVITSIEDELKLTSVKGYYYAGKKAFFFKDSVRVSGEQYRMECDTLEFQTSTSTVHFHGPTDIFLDSSTVHCVAGVYYTQDNFVELWDGAWLYQTNKSLYADSLVYNEKTDIGEGFCNVMLYDSTDNIQFMSDYLWKSRDNDTLLLKESAKIFQFSEKDTLVILADSIFHYQDTAKDQQLFIAENNVAILQVDMRVRCDSAYFSENDSIIKFYYNPIIWNKETQLSADSIFTTYFDNEFHEMKLYSNAFIITEQDSLHYDQIKGKLMTAYLDSGKIQKVHIESNAETLYYVTEESTDSLGNKVKDISGMNRIDCNEIFMYFKSSDVERISFIEQPTATYYPIDQVPANDFFLKGFLWQISRKPTPIFGE